MPRNRQPNPGDETALADLDTGFVGVNNRLDPSLLRSGHPYYDVNKEMMQPGLLADAVNTRFDSGQPRTRPGTLTPIQFNPTPPGFIQIRGAAPFVAKNLERWVLAADVNRVWMLRDGRTPTWVELPAGVILQEPAEIIQTPAQVLMFRGLEAEVLKWDGNRLHAWEMVISPVQDPERPSFLSPPPPADFAVLMSDRLFVPYGDVVVWSDLGDYTSFDLTLNQAPIPHAEGGGIVALTPYQGNRLIVFKEKSIHFMAGVFGDMSSLVVDTVKVPIGCRARRSVVDVGGDILFLADGGVYSLTQTEQAELRTPPVPLSWPIQKWIDRINWKAVAGACAAVDTARNLYLLDVPLDESTTNNARLVFSTSTREWHGMDSVSESIEPTAATLPAAEAIWSFDPLSGVASSTLSTGRPLLIFDTQQLIAGDLFGQRTIFAVEPTRIIALGHGSCDFIDGYSYPIYTRFETRGYIFGQLGIKPVRSMSLPLGTNDAELTVSVITDGVSEVRKIFERRRRNRYRYTAHGKGNWNGTNIDDDFADPGREDYGLLAGDAVQSRSGVPLGLAQEWPASFPVRRMARWAAVRIESFGGNVALKSVQGDALPERRFHRSINP
jgi:hypothetical protein